MGTHAVVYGNSGQPDSLRLVRYTGGLTGPANLKTLVGVSVPAGANAPGPAATVRVLYAPDEDNWTLEVSANTSTFDNPSTASYTRIGIRKDLTYVNTPLPFVGCFWNHATTASEFAVFDNIYVTGPCAVGAEPTQGPGAPTATAVTSSGATLGWTGGNGTGRLVVLRPATAAASAPADGLTYGGNPALGSGSAVGGAFVVYVGTDAAVNVTNLRPSTAYAYQVYELLGAGCATNYLQSAPASGTFTTAACVLASFPSVEATGATAVAAGRSGATITWTSGNGAARLVVVQPIGGTRANPVSGTGYVASSSYGGGSSVGSAAFGLGYVVYSGTGNSVTVSNLTPGTSYQVAVFEFNGAGCSAAYVTSFPATVNYSVPVPAVGTLQFWRGNLHAHTAYSDGNQDAGSSELALSVFPNPTAGVATVSYYLPAGAVVSADVVDLTGRRVRELVAGERQAAGPRALAVPALPGGLYVVRVVVDGVASYRKLVVE